MLALARKNELFTSAYHT